MVRVMDKYYMVGMFALLATAVIALPTIFTESSTSEAPISSTQPNVFNETESNATTVSSTPIELLPTVHPEHGIKLKRSIFDKIFGQVLIGSTIAPAASSSIATSSDFPVFGLVNFTEESTTEHVSSSHHSLFRRDIITDFPTLSSSIPEEFTNVSSTISSENSSSSDFYNTKIPIFILNDEFINTTLVPSADNATTESSNTTIPSSRKPIFTFPFFDKQNDEAETSSSATSESTSFSEDQSTSTTPCSSDPLAVQNDEISSSSSTAATNTTAAFAETSNATQSTTESVESTTENYY